MQWYIRRHSIYHPVITYTVTVKVVVTRCFSQCPFKVIAGGGLLLLPQGIADGVKSFCFQYVIYSAA